MPSFAQVLLRPRKASRQSRPVSLLVPPLTFRLVTWQRTSFSDPLVCSGISGIVDDPGLDRTVPLDLWHHHLAHLGQHLLVRPLSLADEMQQRLMLGRRAMRRRDRRHLLNALALARHQQAGAIMPQRFLAVLVANHARKALDIPRK